MTRIKFTLPVAAALLAPALGSSPASAEAQFIQCPLGKIKTELASDLPQGWASTPVERRLQSVNVVNVNGRGQLLQCNYGAGIVVTSKAPANKTCEIEDQTGFKCNDNAPQRPQTFHTAGVTLSLRDVVNMDGTGNGPWESDIWLQGTNQDNAMLSSFADGLMAKPGPQQGYRGCRNARYASRGIRLEDMNVGDYVCVKTSEDRIAEYRINELRVGRDISVTIGYTTWK
jgi:hypothetical protein